MPFGSSIWSCRSVSLPEAASTVARMRLRLDLHCCAEDGGALPRSLVSVPPSLELVSDLLHHLHRSLLLPPQPLILSIDGFTLLPAQRLADVLRDDDHVQVQLASRSPRLPGRRRNNNTNGALLALPDGNRDSCMVGMFRQQDVIAAGSGFPNFGNINLVKMAGQKRRKADEGLLALPAHTDEKYASDRLPQLECRVYHGEQAKVEPTLAAVEVSSRVDNQNSGLHDPLNIYGKRQRGNRGKKHRVGDTQRSKEPDATFAAGYGAELQHVAATAGCELPDPTVSDLWRPISRPPFAGEIIRFRTREQGSFTGFSAAQCLEVEETNSGMSCTLSSATGSSQALLLDHMFQISVSRAAAPAKSSCNNSRPLAEPLLLPQTQVQTVAEAVRSEPCLQSAVQAAADTETTGDDATVTTKESERPESCLQVDVQLAAPTKTVEVDTTVTAQDPTLAENSLEAAKHLEWVKSAVKRQVDYYFGDTNYDKDNWLRAQADDQGWTSLRLVSKFNRMKEFTRDFQLVQHCAASSSIVELSNCGEFVRRQPCQRW
mmetsp:Transcript_70356/g.139519  ORF Transcript_70356/g.139519 Transcript_70356/m.139519 type:complete len:545 (-) Transcript_70356:148-1782(-)